MRDKVTYDVPYDYDPEVIKELVMTQAKSQDLSTSEPNKNGRIYKGFEPGKLYINDYESCFPSVKIPQSITGIEIMQLTVKVGDIILNELFSYKGSYSDYIDDFRYDILDKTENYYSEILNQYNNYRHGNFKFGWCSIIPRPFLFSRIPNFIKSNKDAVRDLVKLKTSSLYGEIGRGIV